jgi:hypothetical protein
MAPLYANVLNAWLAVRLKPRIDAWMGGRMEGQKEAFRVGLRRLLKVFQSFIKPCAYSLQD